MNGISQVKLIEPQQFGTLPTCTWCVQADLGLATNYTDLWWNANESGWGVNLSHQGDVIFATWFTYDATGNPWWLIAEMRKSANGVYSGPLSTVTGPAFDTLSWNSNQVVETPAGTAAVTFANGNAATFGHGRDRLLLAANACRHAGRSILRRHWVTVSLAAMPSW